MINKAITFIGFVLIIISGRMFILILGDRLSTPHIIPMLLVGGLGLGLMVDYGDKPIKRRKK